MYESGREWYRWAEQARGIYSRETSENGVRMYGGSGRRGNGKNYSEEVGKRGGAITEEIHNRDNNLNESTDLWEKENEANYYCYVNLK